MLYSRNDSVMCLTFLSSIRDTTSGWFYSLPPCSLYNFSEVTEAFLTQYVTRQEAKRNSHHILTVKMRPEASLKSYINFLQNQLTKVSNCDEEVFVLAFISRLQVTHPLYKHLLKHNVAKMSEAFSQAQPYIQLEEAIKTSSNPSTQPRKIERNQSPLVKLPIMLLTDIGGSLLIRSRRSP